MRICIFCKDIYKAHGEQTCHFAEMEPAHAVECGMLFIKAPGDKSRLT